MTPLDRIKRIAAVGSTDIQEPSAVDNMMQNYPQASPQSGGLWNGIKNFAGSDGGRMLLGGLGTAAAVGLTGGNLQDALGYGVIGAGSTANNLTARHKYENELARQQQERNDKLAEAERNRQWQENMQNQRIAAQKEAADLAFDRSLQSLKLKNDIKNQAADAQFNKKLNRLDELKIGGLIDDNQYNTAKLGLYGITTQKPMSQLDFAKSMDYLNKSGASDETKRNFARQNGFSGYEFAPQEKKYPSGDVGTIMYLVDNGVPFQEATATVGMMTPEERIDFEARKTGAVESAKLPYTLQSQNNQSTNSLNNNIVMAGVNSNIHEQQADNALTREMRLAEFKNGLPTETQRNITAQAQAMNIPESDVYQAMYDEQQAKVQQLISNIRRNDAATDKTQAEIPTIGKPSFNDIQNGIKNRTISAETANNKYGSRFGGNVFQEPPVENTDVLAKERAKIQAKKEAEQEDAARQNAILRPKLEQSIARARDAIAQGEGLGQFGGWGWTTGRGGQNRADIQTAQAQINTMMRGLLKEMGVGSTELNSAAEAAAYRYTITPDMPKQQILKILDDFERDYMDGTLTAQAQNIAQQYSGGAGNNLSAMSTEDLIANL